jgi:hypothetical protein
MAYSDERGRVGRLPFQMVKLSLDFCQNQYGVEDAVIGSICTAGQVNTGQVQAATSNSATLDAGASGADNEYDNYAVHITSGTGANQVYRILSYDGTTKIATIDGTWGITPVFGDNYKIIRRPRACYNTRATCQDVSNYDPDPTTNEIYLTESTSDFPINLLDTANLAVAIPCLTNVNITPPKLTIGKGLGIRSAVDITCQDFPHHDGGLDLYRLSRDYDPDSQGTFFGKLFARNPYYNGRALTVYRGYLNQDGTFDINNFETWSYVIENVRGPNGKDVVRITAKDALKLADDDRSQVPSPSTGKLSSNLNIGVLSFTIVPAGTGDAGYPASGQVRINEEIMDFTRIGDDFTVVRATYGTTEDNHNADDTVQYCITYTATNVVDIVQDLLDIAKQSTLGFDNNAGLATSQLDLSNWAIEKANWLNGNNLTNIISTPTGVNKLLTELTEQNLLYIWWSPTEQLIKLKAIAPAPSAISLSDDENFIEDTVSVAEDSSLRITQVWVYYTPKDYTETKIENFSNLYIQGEFDAESDDKYAEVRVKRIQSRWITTEGLAVQLAGRLLTLYGFNPKIAKFKLDNKDDVKLGDPIIVSTRFLQDVDGSNLATNMIIIEDAERDPSTNVQFTAQQFEFVGNYGYIGYSHTGRMQSSPSSYQVVLDVRTSRWEDPSLVIDIDNNICEGPDVDINGISVADTLKDVPAWPDDCFVDHIFHIHAPGETYDGFTTLITAYNAASLTITLEDALPIGVNLGLNTGDIYHIHLPEYTGSYMLKEDGDALLLEDGGLIILEEGATQGAGVLLRSEFCWIGPDAPATTFDDGTELYKIL